MRSIHYNRCMVMSRGSLSSVSFHLIRLIISYNFYGGVINIARFIIISHMMNMQRPLLSSIQRLFVNSLVELSRTVFCVILIIALLLPQIFVMTITWNHTNAFFHCLQPINSFLQ